MNLPLLTLDVRTETDIVLARQRARQIAGLLGFAALDQTRIAVAISEIARNAFEYAGGGKVEFLIRIGATPGLMIRVRERGPGIKDLQAILDGRYDSATGLGLGILGAKRLMDEFEIESSDRGSAVTLVKSLAKQAIPFTQKDLSRLSAELAKQAPQGLLEELQLQNQELLRTLQELRDRQSEVAELHSRELEETNRGVVALYSELDDNAIELKRISELKTRFLSNMSHEFRSPLNTILSMSGFLLDGSSGDLTAEQRKEIGFIRKAAEGLQLLVNDLLDLAKVEAGKAVIRLETFDVATLLDGLRGTTAPLLTPGTVSLVVETPEDVLPLQTDEGKITQILRNFLSNAAKFTERGEIRIFAKPGPGDTVIFAVSDTGFGIALKDQRRIFEEFSQIDGPMQRRVKGTGLGLPLSRKLAELLGGGVSVRSEPGIGSTFYLVTPRIYTSPAEENETDCRWNLTPGASPVLVVDDDPVDMLLYRKYLENSGFQVLPARTLGEARRLLRRVRPQAILLDVFLESEGGWTLLEEIRTDSTTKLIPIFVLTVFDGEERALSLGAAEFRFKPIDRDWLLERLRALEQEGPIHRILIIDDEEADRYRLRNLLSAQGRFDVAEATTGGDGIRKARANRPDVIFLDLMMDDMTGFEVLERLKAESSTRHIPIIINTSNDLDDEARNRLAPGTVAILSKLPVAAEDAFKTIREALIRAGLRMTPATVES